MTREKAALHEAPNLRLFEWTQRANHVGPRLPQSRSMSARQALAVGLAKAALDASKKTAATSPAAIFVFFIRHRPRSWFALWTIHLHCNLHPFDNESTNSYDLGFPARWLIGRRCASLGIGEMVAPSLEGISP